MKDKSNSCTATGGSIYGLGFFGAAIFYIGHAATFWAGVLGFLKACIWPLFFVLESLNHFAAETPL